jgi:hypothetical protein
MVDLFYTMQLINPIFQIVRYGPPTVTLRHVDGLCFAVFSEVTVKISIAVSIDLSIQVTMLRSEQYITIEFKFSFTSMLERFFYGNIFLDLHIVSTLKIVLAQSDFD